jgi:hypothetical protein
MTNDKGGDENQISFLSTGIPQPIKLGIPALGLVLRFISRLSVQESEGKTFLSPSFLLDFALLEQQIIKPY